MKLLSNVENLDLNKLVKVNYYGNGSYITTSIINHITDFSEVQNDGVATYNYILDENIIGKRYINNSSTQGVFHLSSGNLVLKLILDYYVDSFIGYDKDDKPILVCGNESPNEWNDKLEKLGQPNNYYVEESKFRRVFILRLGERDKTTDVIIHKLNPNSHKNIISEVPFDSYEYSMISSELWNELVNLFSSQNDTDNYPGSNEPYETKINKVTVCFDGAKYFTVGG